MQVDPAPLVQVRASEFFHVRRKQAKHFQQEKYKQLRTRSAERPGSRGGPGGKRRRRVLDPSQPPKGPGPPEGQDGGRKLCDELCVALPASLSLWQNIIAEMKALGTSGAGPSGDSSSSRGLAFRATWTQKHLVL